MSATEQHPLPWLVRMGVKGAYRIHAERYATEAEARRRAERWERSNSIGSYYAVVRYQPEGSEL